MHRYQKSILKGLCILTAISAMALPARVEAAQVDKAKSWFGEELNMKAGGDIRLRQIYFDNIPLNADPPGITRGGDNSFFRFRTRLWGQFDPVENWTLRGRVVNEFRYYEKPENDSWDALDEIVVDTLYLEGRELFGGQFDLRIGRQDLIYGTGKLILDGTPKDGSRTIYMDAIKATWKGIDATTIDLLGIYNQPENELVLGGQDRDLTGWDPNYNDMTESGGGVYVKNKGMETLPWEAYYLYKHESDWTTLDRETGDSLPQPEADIHTLGFRIMPKPSETWDGNLEAAMQTGDRAGEDQEGYMIDALASYHIGALAETKGTVGLGWYYLSGDDPNTPKDEGWNPLWARWPQYSELYVYAFDADGAGRWSNVSMPHLDFSMAPKTWWKTSAMVGYMMAPEDDGPGDGTERGLLGVLWNRFTLATGWLTSKDQLSGHLLLEALDPGDYYNVDDLAYFARWEFVYGF